MKTKNELPACPVATAVSLIGGKWKLLILRNLKARPWRFNELQRDLDGISQKVLTDSLRQMIDDGLAYRRDYHEMPPKVEYGLTDLGRQMLPIIDALADFGNIMHKSMNTIMEKLDSRLGEKTFFDSVVPAAKALCDEAAVSDEQRLKNAAEAARNGAESTRDMVAKHGRAAYFGEKTLGSIDGGAEAGCIIFEAIAEQF